jgi:hypothetical protein
MCSKGRSDSEGSGGEVSAGSPTVVRDPGSGEGGGGVDEHEVGVFTRNP